MGFFEKTLSVVSGQLAWNDPQRATAVAD